MRNQPVCHGPLGGGIGPAYPGGFESAGPSSEASPRPQMLSRIEEIHIADPNQLWRPVLVCLETNEECGLHRSEILGLTVTPLEYGGLFRTSELPEIYRYAEEMSGNPVYFPRGATLLTFRVTATS